MKEKGNEYRKERKEGTREGSMKESPNTTRKE